jgi:HEAT repeat protein
MSGAARRAVAEALPNLIYLAAVAALVTALSHRDWFARQWARLEAYRGRGPDGAELEVSALRAAISAYEHRGAP